MFCSKRQRFFQRFRVLALDQLNDLLDLGPHGLTVTRRDEMTAAWVKSHRAICQNDNAILGVIANRRCKEDCDGQVRDAYLKSWRIRNFEMDRSSGANAVGYAGSSSEALK